MASQSPVKFVLGAHLIGPANSGSEHHPQINNAKDARAVLDAFHSRGFKDIDTGRNYLGSEVLLGEVGAATDLHLKIHTKVRDTHEKGAHEAAKIRQCIDASLKELKTSCVETLYLHVPDRQTPFEETARAVNDAIREGKVKHFGISNYTPAEVQKFVEICEEHNLTKPTLYQGHYNPFVRGGEEELFPILRKHGIRFFAFSPAAGGLLSGHKDTSHRWGDKNHPARLYNTLYGHESIQAAASMVRDAASKHGISGHAALLRWTAFHSILDGNHGDGVIFGVSKLEHVDKALDALEAGALPQELVEVINSVKDMIKGHEPGFHL